MDMQFDFDSLLTLLAGHLYADKHVFLRELLQNAHDSIRRRQAVDPDAPPPCVAVRSFPQDLFLEIQDTGIGMDAQDIQTFLSTIGNSATRLHKGEVAGLVGQFGIGFLSSFLVARRVEVRTRRYDASEGWLWVNEGRQHYDLQSCPMAGPGTCVKLILKGPDERGLLYEEELRLLIKRYADMLAVPIFLNTNPDPVNRQAMPWEANGLMEEERRIACHVFLEETMPDHVLEVIPFSVEVDECLAAGVLYLTKTRTLGIAIERSVRLYLSRMFLTDQASDLLPKWATFVNGVINAEGLTPTAARDNYFRNSAADRVREALGQVVLEHFASLHQHNPERFRAIQRYHALGVKAACFYHQDLFSRLAPMLLWRTAGWAANGMVSRPAVWKTIPEIIEAFPFEPDSVPRLPYFTDTQSSDQYLALATASRMPVIDASYLFERELLQQYQQLPGVPVQFVHLEEEDAFSVFQPASDPTAVPYPGLTETLAQGLSAHHTGLQIKSRHFEPASLPAILRMGEGGAATRCARSLLEDPNVTDELQDMAKELLAMSRRGTTSQLVINAASPLVKRMGEYGENGKPHFPLLIQGLYYMALLHRGESGASADHLQQLRAYLTQLLDLVMKMGDVQIESQSREREFRHARCAKLAVSRTARPPMVCVIASSDFQGQAVWGALTEWVEDCWECEVRPYVLDSSTFSFADPLMINDLTRADLVVLGGSRSDTIVAYLLGWILGQSLTCPVCHLAPSGTNDSSLRGCGVRPPLLLEYDSPFDDRAASRLRAELEAMPDVKDLLEDPARLRFLSARRLAQLTQLPIPASIFQVLARNFPTSTLWYKVRAEEIKPLLHEFVDLADPLCQRLTEQLRVRDSGGGST